MHLAASIALIVIGLTFALVLDIAGDMRMYGWVLAGVGIVGLIVRPMIARRGDDRDPRRRPR